jgi:hypothetical protein
MMRLKVLAALVFAALVVPPAMAQKAPAPPSAKTTTSSLDDLIGAGYEIKAVTELSDKAVAKIFTAPNNATGQAAVLITLQKGTSIATCSIWTIDWTNLPDVAFTDANACVKR